MKICDRCKKEGNIKTIEFFGNAYSQWWINYTFGASKESIDLCEECNKAFWIEFMGRKEEQNIISG